VCKTRGHSKCKHTGKLYAWHLRFSWLVGTDTPRSYATRVSQLKICNFWVIDIARNVCRCTFNRYNVITQFTKFAAESSCIIAALIENYNISKPLNVSPEKSHILCCDTVVANERYATIMFWKVQCKSNFMQDRMECTYGQLCRYLQGSPVAMKTPTCRLATGWPPCCPAVFFCHPFLIACSFFQEKLSVHFKEFMSVFFFFFFFQFARYFIKIQCFL